MVGVLLLESASQLDDESGEPPLTGVEHALFGIGEAGEIELRELLQRLLGLEEAGLELARGGAERGDCGLAGSGRGRARIAHQRFAGRRVRGGPPGGEQGVGLSGAEPVTHDAVGQSFLLSVRPRRQGMCRRGREAPVVEMSGQFGGQPTAEGQAPVHPPAAAPEELGDLGGREMSSAAREWTTRASSIGLRVRVGVLASSSLALATTAAPASSSTITGT